MKCLRTNISRLPVVAAAIAVTAMPALACGDNERVIVETRGPSIHAKAITVVMGGEGADHVIEVRVENGETTVIVNGEEIAPDRFRTENGNVIVFDEDGNEIQSVKLFMKAGDPGFILTMPGKEGLRWQFHRPHANVMLGVHLADPGAALRKHLRLEPGEGSMIRGLYEGLPAHRAGLQQYDVIIAVDGEPVDDSGTILAALADAEAGDEVTLSVVQNGRHKQFTVTLDAFDAAKMGPANLIGGEEGRGLQQILSGLELGRINVAARGVGIARVCLEEALAYAQVRKTFGKPICEHQTIQIKLADMATRVEAARLLTESAARAYDTGQRCDLEAGMAKLYATEAALTNSLEAMRIHGAYGYSKEFNIERYYRDAPLLAIGEGTNELQRIIIARQLVERNPV